METKQLEPKEKVLTFFGEIKSATVEATIKEIVKINLTDRAYAQQCVQWAIDNKLAPMAVTLTPIELYLSTYGGGCYDGLALYDVIEQCRITGSSDASIKDVVPADLSPILQAADIGGRIYTNGAKAHDLYMRHIYPVTGIAAVKLPSTSPANAAWSLPRRAAEWQKQIGPLMEIRK